MSGRNFSQAVLIVCLCFAASCSNQHSAMTISHNKDGGARGTAAIVQMKDNYWTFYQEREELTIKSIEELAVDDIGIKITLQSHWKDFSHFLISADESGPRESVDGTIMAEFAIDNPSSQKTEIVVKMVSKDGRVSQPYTITLICNPSKFWAASGAMGYPNWITVKTYPYLNFTSPRTVEDWIYLHPTDEEIRFAEAKWGDLIKDADSNYEKAKLLSKTLMDDLKPHVGVPSDAMNAPPFVQYERMSSGIDKGFCSNFATIFVHACTSFGIPARRIHLEKVHSRGDKLSVRMGGMHSTTEIFDDKLNQWIWIDLTYNVQGAYLGEEGPLNMAEVSLFLNHPQRRKRLRIHTYNYKDKTENILPLDQCRKKKFSSLDGRDTEFHYLYPAN